MIRLVPTWNITPKDGVAEKFDVNQNKKWNIFFGILEFSNIYTLVMIIINLFRRHAEHIERTADLHFIIQAIPYIQKEQPTCISLFRPFLIYRQYLS